MSRNNDFEAQRSAHGREETVVFDLDGTLVSPMKNEPHHKGLEGKNISFAQEALDAPPMENMVEKFNEAKAEGKSVVILTARSAHYRSETKHWLNKNNLNPDALFMRPVKNVDEDQLVKKDLMEKNILPKYNVKKAYDDRGKNRRMFEKLGIEAKGVE